MTIAPIPDNEAQRLASLLGLKLLDTPAEDRFDRITRIAARALGVPLSIFTVVDQHRQWFKSSHGAAIPRETPREQSFCAHAILDEKVMVVRDASFDPRFSDNPFVTGAPHIRFYAGCPVTAPDGQRIGVLCVFDQEAREFAPADYQLLSDLAALTSEQLAK